MTLATKTVTPARLRRAKQAYTESIALACLPQEVKQKDGSSRYLCWTGRINRAQRMVEGERDADRRALLLQAFERLLAEHDTAMQRMQDAQAQYHQLCAAAHLEPDDVDVECDCEWCSSNKSTLHDNVKAKLAC